MTTHRFHDLLHTLDPDALQAILEGTTPGEVERVLGGEHVADRDLPVLFSRTADALIEPLAQRSAEVTRRRFGRVIQLYAPLYLSNECINRCAYCGFSRELDMPRVTLTPDQVGVEARILHDEGFRHVLLVSGEHPRRVRMAYLEECIAAIRDLFASIAIEIQPLTTDKYRQLVEAGVDGLALYQETYHRDVYARYHLAGPKRDFDERLDAIERGGEAGMRSLGIGALLGLAPWRTEAALVALHGRFLQRRYWRSKVAVSFPRIQPSAHHYQPACPVSDRELVHMICAMRLALPDAELVLSTREPAWLRDHMIGLGITRMSAGSRTHPGGYAHPEAQESGQFEVGDARPPGQVAAAIAARGHEPVWKDFDREFMAVGVPRVEAMPRPSSSLQSKPEMTPPTTTDPSES